MGIESQLDKLSPALRAKYRQHKAEIMPYRAAGHDLRERVRQDPVRNGHLLTREMHPTELEAVKELCSDTAAHNARVRLKAWYWVLRQDWGKDLRASPFEQRYYGQSTDAKR